MPQISLQKLKDHHAALIITGGEPLMSKDCWSVMDKVSENPSEELTLSINSNLSVPDHMIDRLKFKLTEDINNLSEIIAVLATERLNSTPPPESKPNLNKNVPSDSVERVVFK